MQREREMRGVTLEEISESTKISTRALRALEDEDFDRLPGGIFNKGFVRAYARYLGIDEEQAVADFLAAAGEEEPPPPLPESQDTEPSGATANWAGLAVVVVLVAAAAVGAWKLYPTVHRWGARAWEARFHLKAGTPAGLKPSPTPQPVTAGNAGTAPQPPPAGDAVAKKPQPAADPVRPPAITPPPPKPAVSAPVEGEGFVVQIRATKDSWIQVTADGTLSEALLKPAEEKLVRARNLVVLKTGNAGGVEVSFNGQPLPPLGSDNQVTTVTFTPEGLQR